MENEKKYEGTVTITSAEYRELVTEAVTQKHNADDYRSEKWKAESERNELKKECDELRKRLADAETQLAAYKLSLSRTTLFPSEGLTVTPCRNEIYGGNI